MHFVMVLSKSMLTITPNRARSSPVVGGARVANVDGMDKSSERKHGRTASFVRIVRAFAEASLVVVGFGAAILLLGLPFALSVRGVYEGAAWLARQGDDMSALIYALVSAVSAFGALALAAVSLRLRRRRL